MMEMILTVEQTCLKLSRNANGMLPSCIMDVLCNFCPVAKGLEKDAALVKVLDFGDNKSSAAPAVICCT